MACSEVSRAGSWVSLDGYTRLRLQGLDRHLQGVIAREGDRLHGRSHLGPDPGIGAEQGLDLNKNGKFEFL